MEPWYNIFSYWGILLWLISSKLPFPVLSIMILNLIGTLLFVSVSNTPVLFDVFLIFIHVVPVWFLRKQEIQVKPALLMFTVYTLFLAIQNKNPVGVYKELLDNPPQTIGEYLRFRFS